MFFSSRSAYCLLIVSSLFSHAITAESVSNNNETQKATKLKQQKLPFGQLPQYIDQDKFINWIAPQEEIERLTITGSRLWGKTGLYVGMACFAWDKENANQSKKQGDTHCGTSFINGEFITNKFYLGVFQLEEHEIIPVARLAEPLDSIASPASFIGVDEKKNPGVYEKFDLAPYKLSNSEMAFGVRSGYSEGYSGGGAYVQYLQLFKIKNTEIISIFNEPIYEYVDLAGDWNSDGTRQHDISEYFSTLHILKTTTHGLYDLQVRTRPPNQQSATYQWSNEHEKYIYKENQK